MPDPTQNNQNNNQVPPVGTTPSDTNTPATPAFQTIDSSATTSTMPIDTTTSTTTPPIVEPISEPEDSDKGSAAPATENFSVTPPPKKKFGGGKIIATILGFLVLAGGIAGGVVLTQQNQNIAEKAGACAAHPCGPGLECDGSGGCRPSGSGDDYDGPVIDPPDNPWGGDGGDPSDGNNCDVRCQGTDARGTSYDFCIDRTSTTGCDGAAEDLGYVVQIGSVTCVRQSNGFWEVEDGLSYSAADNQCTELCSNQSTCNFGTGAYICPRGHTGACTSTNGTPFTGNINGCFCGVVQVDTGSGHTSFSSSCGCGEEDIPPEGTPPPGVQAASCQNVKAYSSTWTQLTATQLSALTVGSQVNFCVAGTTTQGIFDKAKFTINSVAQAETTTQRPSSTDFCQSYTITAGTTTVAVTAQIHHPTLGWK